MRKQPTIEQGVYPPPPPFLAPGETSPGDRGKSKQTDPRSREHVIESTLCCYREVLISESYKKFLDFFSVDKKLYSSAILLLNTGIIDPFALLFCILSTYNDDASATGHLLMFFQSKLRSKTRN